MPRAGSGARLRIRQSGGVGVTDGIAAPRSGRDGGVVEGGGLRRLAFAGSSTGPLEPAVELLPVVGARERDDKRASVRPRGETYKCSDGSVLPWRVEVASERSSFYKIHSPRRAYRVHTGTSGATITYQQFACKQ